jgi:hypothetical protein
MLNAKRLAIARVLRERCFDAILIAIGLISIVVKYGW